MCAEGRRKIEARVRGAKEDRENEVSVTAACMEVSAIDIDTGTTLPEDGHNLARRHLCLTLPYLTTRPLTCQSRIHSSIG